MAHWTHGSSATLLNMYMLASQFKSFSMYVGAPKFPLSINAEQICMGTANTDVPQEVFTTSQTRDNSSMSCTLHVRILSEI
ncbi:hypothetical protein BBBOND_0210800 [Babesia bigemina]|uniref:Uncharacterized protein n=1 Tax=Babesia bigemina TaxID=5866 RepID=A0A061DD41_BABBI|nr:hypothetical protein BBBOND_0210800 [Babesia bigemina]CDR95930.1 hypothetical protein BBBOND_0210800 [Babesia bigemina]|eukprot:XP_012768116.1 hypothetical protein BBBOND_0210800 [Babesia bigemina]